MILFIHPLFPDMKSFRSLVLCAVLFAGIPYLPAQESNVVVFTYDAAGNMTERRIQVLPGARFGQPQLPKDTLQRPFSVYPNPTSQYLTVEGPLPEHAGPGELRLLNVNGQVLKKDSYTGQAKTLLVDDLKPGLYLLEIRYSKKQKSTYKIIISH